MFIVTHCYRLAGFYLIYDPRVNPVSIQSRATIGPPAKRHLDGVSLTGRQCPDFTCILGSLTEITPFCCKGYTLNIIYVSTFQFHFSDAPITTILKLNFVQICAFQSAKIKRCFEIIFYHFTIFGFKNVKIIFFKKISVLSVVLFIKVQVISDPSS